MYPSLGRIMFSFVLSCYSVFSVSDPTGAFLADTALLKGTQPRISLMLLPELQKNQDTVDCAALRRRGPKSTLRTTGANLDCAFFENAIFHTDP